MHNSILEQSLRDVSEDLRELEYIAGSLKKTLENFQKDMVKTERFITPLSPTFVRRESNRYISTLHTFLSSLHPLREKCRKANSDSQFAKILEEKKDMKDYLRSISGIISTIITSTDWQSPSFAYSVFPNSGRQTGKISAGINDYKRDTHLDGQYFERQYVKEYVDARFKFPIHAYAVNSGMAAFTTILNFLVMEDKITRGVLIGKHVYFQNKFLLTSMVKKGITQIEEWKTDKIISLIRNKRPSVIYFDTLSTSIDTPIPNIQKIIQALITYTKKDTYLLLDNTCLSISFQVWKYVLGKSRKLHTIVFESLNKFSQLGLDREMGGMILTYGKDTDKIFEYRKNSGTIITHNSVYAIPYPNKKILSKRITRHGRNSQYLAEKLQSYVDNHPYSAIEKINYPELAAHYSYAWSKNMPFKGTFFTLVFKSRLRSKRKYQQFIDLVMKLAKDNGVPIIEGTSFGLDTTRIYLAAAYTTHAVPFIRVSVGTETMDEVEKIAEVFIQAMDAFTHSLRTKIPFL